MITFTRFDLACLLVLLPLLALTGRGTSEPLSSADDLSAEAALERALPCQAFESPRVLRP